MRPASSSREYWPQECEMIVIGERRIHGIACRVRRRRLRASRDVIAAEIPARSVDIGAHVIEVGDTGIAQQRNDITVAFPESFYVKLLRGGIFCRCFFKFTLLDGESIHMACCFGLHWTNKDQIIGGQAGLRNFAVIDGERLPNCLCLQSRKPRTFTVGNNLLATIERRNACLN